MMHIVERSRDMDTRVACTTIQMLRLPVLAELMSDDEVERIVNLVSIGSDVELRQEAALFVNAQVFQDPGICIPEGKNKKKHKRRGRDRARSEEGMSDMSDIGDFIDDDDQQADNIRTLLNS